MPPVIVAFFRGLALAALAGAIEAAIVFAGNADLQGYDWLPPLILWGLRQLEGLLDQLKERAQ